MDFLPYQFSVRMGMDDTPGNLSGAGPVLARYLCGWAAAPAASLDPNRDWDCGIWHQCLSCAGNGRIAALRTDVRHSQRWLLRCRCRGGGLPHSWCDSPTPRSEELCGPP